MHRGFACIVGDSLGRRVSDCVVASQVWGIVGGCSNLLYLGVGRVVACVAGRFVWGVSFRTVPLFLKFGGVLVDVEFGFLFWCVVVWPATWGARLGRRVSDCVVASKDWGCVDGC